MTTPQSDLEKRLAQLEAENELANLSLDYCYGLDNRDLDRFIAIWSDDAEWILGGNPVKGRDAIAKLASDIWARHGGLQHWTTNQVVDWSGESTTASVEAGAIVREPEGRWTLGYVTYADQYAFIDSAWKITRREGLNASSKTLD